MPVLLDGTPVLQAYQVLGVLMSIVGGFCSITCSLLMPSFFYAVLHWPELSTARRAGCCSLLCAGAAFVVLIVSSDVSVLVQQLQAAGTLHSRPVEHRLWGILRMSLRLVPPQSATYKPKFWKCTE